MGPGEIIVKARRETKAGGSGTEYGDNGADAHVVALVPNRPNGRHGRRTNNNNNNNKPI